MQCMEKCLLANCLKYHLIHTSDLIHTSEGESCVGPLLIYFTTIPFFKGTTQAHKILL